MDFFSGLAAFPGIILGVAVSRSLTGLAHLVVDRSRVTWSWPFVAWGLFFIIACASQWYYFLADWANLPYYTIYEFFFTLAEPMILFFISALMFQSLPPSGQIDLWDHFDRARPWFLTLASIYTVLYIVDAYVLTKKMGSPLVSSMPAGQAILTLVIAVLLGVGAFLGNRTFHRLLFPIVLILFVILNTFFVPGT